MNEANFEIVSDEPTYVVIRDIGPWDKHPTVTNAAEGVVARLAPALAGEYNENRRLFYYDSNGQLDEMLVDHGRFAGFRPGGPHENPSRET
jgi:hypothetical protein